MSLRTKLVGIILLVLLPTACYDAVQIATRFERFKERQLETSRELAEVTATSFAIFLNRVWELELAVGTAILLGDTPLVPDEAWRVMTRLAEENPAIRGYDWFDPDGRRVVGLYEDEKEVYVGDRSYFQAIVAGVEKSISPLTSGRLSNAPAVLVARGIRRDDALVGVIVAAVDPAHLPEVMRSGEPGRALTGIVDSQGQVIFTSDSAQNSVGTIKNGADVQEVLSRREPVLSERFVSAIDGRERMGAATAVPGTDWVAFSSVTLEDVYDLAWQELRGSVLVTALTIALALTAGLVASNWIVRPVRRLQSAAKRIMEGDSTARAGVDGWDEIAAAGQSFDEMADRIQHLEMVCMRLIHAAAHELRNPIASVKAALQLLKVYVSADRPKEVLIKTADRAEREVDRISNLLTDFVDAFRFQEGTLALEFERVDLVEVVHKALRPVRETVLQWNERYTLDVRFSGAPDAESRIEVMGDAYRLEQLVRNLAANAFKYSPDGGTVSVEVEVRGVNALLSVRDQGLGIPSEDLPHIFESFYRGRRAEDLGVEGLGVGLYICREIATRHGGRIWAESSEAGGSGFFVELPLADPSKQ